MQEKEREKIRTEPKREGEGPIEEPSEPSQPGEDKDKKDDLLKKAKKAKEDVEKARERSREKAARVEKDDLEVSEEFQTEAGQ